MNKHNEICKRLRGHYKGAPAALALGLALFSAAEARADYSLAGRTTMRVAMHAELNTPLPSQATITAAFTQGTTAIQQDSGVQDVACPLTLAMHNSFGTTYAGGSGAADDDISSSAELTATQNTSPALVNIVDSITSCGGTSANFAGCATVGTRRGFVVTKIGITGGVGGIILAHEFGHSAGRNHDNNALRIMDPDPLTTAHVEVTPFGCDNETDSFRRVFPASCTGNPACSSELVIVETGDDFLSSVARSPAKSPGIEAVESEVFEENDFSAFSITELLDGGIIDRAPAELEDYFGDDDVDELIAIMFDPARSQHHLNAVNFVGLISSGTDAHVQALIDYVGQPQAYVDVAMISLGVIANRTGNISALLFLADQFSSGPNADAASAGLGVSGDSLARDLLLEAAQRETDPIAKFTLEERVSENERIELLGLREHYLNPPGVAELPAGLLPAPVVE